MPIYEYKCIKCGNKFEELVSSFSSPAIPCPSCGHQHTEKQMSAAAGIVAHGGSSCPSASGCAAAGSSCCSGGSCPMSGM